MLTQIFQPGHLLKDFINRHILLKEENSSRSTVLFQIPPTGYCGLGIHLSGNSVSVNGLETASAFLIGQFTRRIKVQYNGDLAVLVSFFNPSQLFRLFAFSMHKLTDTTVPLSAVIGEGYSQKLLNEIQETPDDIKKVSLLENFLLAKIKETKVKWNPADKAIRDIIKKKGNFSVEELARANNVTRRYLEKNFRERIGLTPKQYSKIIRFNYLLELMGKTSEPAWLDLLEECGYYDQAHLIKDFHEFTGEVPSRFLKADRIDMQILERFK